LRREEKKVSDTTPEQTEAQKARHALKCENSRIENEELALAWGNASPYHLGLAEQARREADKTRRN
jgi:hypothetical protein